MQDRHKNIHCLKFFGFESELQTGRLVQAWTRPESENISPNPKTNWRPKSCPKNPKIKLGLKNLAMLPNYFDYIFVHLRQKVRLGLKY